MSNGERPLIERETIAEYRLASRQTAIRLLAEAKERDREIVKVEHRRGELVSTYETTPDRLELLINRLKETGKVKVL